MLTVKRIRQQFFDFFESKGHKVVPSAPMVVKNDPTLMFTNAGMNQFKDIFLGNQPPEYKRIADTQKCLRVSGKHNDLEEVGLDTYHHTMFEMLGNWSFGDYFKKEAIAWAWELLTNVYGINKDCLYVTIFEGDKKDQLPEDSEAFEIWRTLISEDRILRFSKKDNFWEMGDTGPCGPCSEIHVDLRTEEEKKKADGKTLVNQGHPEVVEIWNLVFIQFNRLKNGELQPLSDKYVDTGMGLERLAMVLQDKRSNYDTDVFKELISKVGQLTGYAYHNDQKKDVAVRVIVDHVRAVAFAIADGQLPSNVGAGYVIRRILRRAVRYAYSYLDFHRPVLSELIPVLAGNYEGIFPELEEQKDLISKIVLEEENAFLRTLETGLKKLDEIEKENKQKGISNIKGEQAFELYDTFGFPLDLTSLIAAEKGFEIDEKGFAAEMQKQKNRSRDAAHKDLSDWVIVSDPDEQVSFVGYDTLEASAQVIKYRKVTQKGKDFYQVVLNKTPFYAESGGQVGDKGTLIFGEKEIHVFDTKKENDLIVHYVKELPEDPDGEVTARVNQHRRPLIVANHSATHLLHAALREVLGDHVQQKGSYLDEKYLRFDFTHFTKVADEELARIEDIVNRKIRQNIPLDEKRDLPIQEAMNIGATALFGEKYGEKVRVVIFDKNYSMELCGGTHVQATGEIGLFKIVSEAAIAAGIRRIEAVTGPAALEFVNKQIAELDQVKELLKAPKNVPEKVLSLLEDNQDLTKRIEQYQQKEAAYLAKSLLGKARSIKDVKVIIEKLEGISPEVAKNIVFDLKKNEGSLFIVLGTSINGMANLTLAISENLTKEKAWNAGNIVRDLATEIQGGGGGQAFFATAGGKKPEGIESALSKAFQFVENN